MTPRRSWSTGYSFNGGAVRIEGSRTRTSGFEAAFHDYKAKRGKTIRKEFQVRWLHNILRRHCATDF